MPPPATEPLDPTVFRREISMGVVRHLSSITGLALILILTFAPDGAEAQRNQRIRQGFFFGAGLGYSSITLPGDEESRDAVSGMVRVGGSLTPRILVGVESIIYTEREPANTLLFVTLTPALWIYPLGEIPLFVKVGAGLAVQERDRGLFGGNNNDGGLGFTAGLGWDIHITESFALSPYATWARGRLNDGDGEIWQAGVAFTGF